MGTIGALESALKPTAKVENWSEVLHVMMAEALNALEAELGKQGLILPGVDKDMNYLRKIPEIRDALKPTKKAKR